MADNERGYVGGRYIFAPTTKEGPKNPYRTARETDQQELDLIRGEAARYARTCEQAFFRMMRGELDDVDEERQAQLVQASTSIREQLDEVKEKTLGYGKLTAIYQQLTKPAGIPFEPEDEVGPSNPNLTSLFETMDDVFSEEGASFMQSFIDLPTTKNGQVHPLIKQMTQAALVLSDIATGELRFPIDDPILPNQWVRNGETQFDGIIVHTGELEEIKTFEDILAEGLHWSMLEIKTVFRSRLTSGKNKLRAPLNETVRQSKTVLANFLKNHQGPFQFPRNLDLIYLRGLQPSVYHRMPLDSSFWRKWHEEYIAEYSEIFKDRSINDPTAEELRYMAEITKWAAELRMEEERIKRDAEREEVRKKLAQARERRKQIMQDVSTTEQADLPLNSDS